MWQDMKTAWEWVLVPVLLVLLWVLPWESVVIRFVQKASGADGEPIVELGISQRKKGQKPEANG
jgi:hypothetical protein